MPRTKTNLVYFDSWILRHGYVAGIHLILCKLHGLQKGCGNPDRVLLMLGLHIIRPAQFLADLVCTKTSATGCDPAVWIILPRPFFDYIACYPFNTSFSFTVLCFIVSFSNLLDTWHKNRSGFSASRQTVYFRNVNTLPRSIANKLLLLTFRVTGRWATFQSSETIASVRRARMYCTGRCRNSDANYYCSHSLTRQSRKQRVAPCVFRRSWNVSKTVEMSMRFPALQLIRFPTIN